MSTASLNPRTMSKRTGIILAVGLVAALIFLVDGYVDTRWLGTIAKPLPVLLMPAWLSFLPEKGRFQWAVIGGLVLSAAGDIFLSLASSTFLVGLIAFLLAHVAYTFAFLQDSRRPSLWRAFLAYGYGLLMYAYLLTAGELGAMTIPVLIYVIIIGTMLWRAAARVGTPGVARLTAQAGLFGALFFTLSDSLLSLNMFVAPLPLERLLVMLTYWAGQLGFTLAAAWQQE